MRSYDETAVYQVSDVYKTSSEGTRLLLVAGNTLEGFFIANMKDEEERHQ